LGKLYQCVHNLYRFRPLAIFAVTLSMALTRVGFDPVWFIHLVFHRLTTPVPSDVRMKYSATASAEAVAESDY